MANSEKEEWYGDPNWYGAYESHEPDEYKENNCRLGVMYLADPPYSDENHDVGHQCILKDQHDGEHECSCGEKF